MEEIEMRETSQWSEQLYKNTNIHLCLLSGTSATLTRSQKCDTPECNFWIYCFIMDIDWSTWEHINTT